MIYDLLKDELERSSIDAVIAFCVGSVCRFRLCRWPGIKMMDMIL